MLQLKPVLRIARLTFLSCICTGALISASASAIARERESARGYSGNASAESTSSAASRNLCFTTNNAVEAERGIRHWNNCK